VVDGVVESELPPPTTVNAAVSATAWATARVPASKRGSSNTPIGPFQNTVRASAMRSPKSAAVPGPMSTPFQPAGTVVPTWRTSPPAAGFISSPPGPRAVMSDGSTSLSPCSSSSALQVSTMSSSNRLSPMPEPPAARNVKHIPPPMSSESATCSSASMTCSLSLTLEPPRMATNGRRGCDRSPPSTSTSRASSRPAAEGRNCGGPTIEAWARWEAPKASFT
jgi:hypothetical protein